MGPEALSGRIAIETSVLGGREPPGAGGAPKASRDILGP